MAERILHPSCSPQVPKEWMIWAVSMKGELVELVAATNAQEVNGPAGLVDAGADNSGKTCAIDTGTPPVVYPTDACSGSTQEYEDVATAMMEFASPTHAAIMTCKEYTALRQGVGPVGGAFPYPPIRYPNPKTVCSSTGSEGSSSIFSRIRRTYVGMLIAFPFWYSSPQTHVMMSSRV